jgi:CHAT domain-containing protein
MSFKIRLVALLVLITIVTPGKSVLAENRGAGATGDISWQRGKPIEAIDLWREEAKLYHEEKKLNLELETILKISQGYTKLGQFRLALLELEKTKGFLELKPKTRALIELRIGNAHSGNGNNKSAVVAYQKSLEQQVFLATLNNLVKTLRELKQSTLSEAKEIIRVEDSRDYYSLAESYDSQANVYANQALTLSEREISLASVYALIEFSKLENVLSLKQLARGQEIINKLPKSEKLVYLLINWAGVDTDRSVYWLAKADAIAKTFKDPQLESYVLLELGYFYQKQQNLELALNYAQKAESKANSTSTSESYYRSQRLIADIYQAQGQNDLALEKYKNAIDTIDILIKAVSSHNSSRTIEFNKEVQPVYEDALKLILEKPDSSSLRDAIVISDKLRLLQINSYFGENCFEVETRQLSNSNSSHANKNIATINSVILQNKVYFILRLPDGRVIKSERMISQAELYESIEQWRNELNISYSWKFRDRSEFFYDLIIKPFEAELASVQDQEKVLVFVHDGILRNLPMAALFDGKNYLIEKWAISSSIGLKMTTEPSRVSRSKALVFGLSIPDKKRWSEIPNVAQEVMGVGDLIESDDYLNSSFTEKKLSEQLRQESYSILHLATHGYFGGTAKTSYILAYDKKISVPELESLLENSVTTPNLLVLSACETALSTELSILGLAGVAAKSGVNSTLATLWQVSDKDQVEIIHDFYTNLDDDLSNKAIALQKAQVKQIKQIAHPQKWAALNLIGN